jgi:hypothetical protein
MKYLAVEIFYNNTFCKWFLAHSIKEVLETIQRLEGKELIECEPQTHAALARG